MLPEMNNTKNEISDKQTPKNKSAISRWIVGVLFAMFALVNDFHFSSFILLGAAALMLPIPAKESFLKKKKISSVTAIFLSLVLFFVGIITSPTFEHSDSSFNDTIQNTTDDTEIENSYLSDTDSSAYNDEYTDESDSTTAENDHTKITDDTTSENSTDIETDSTTVENNTVAETGDTIKSEDVKATMVWVPLTGAKYHSKSTCSNMNSPSQIPLEDAENQGYEPCKRCY